MYGSLRLRTLDDMNSLAVDSNVQLDAPLSDSRFTNGSPGCDAHSAREVGIAQGCTGQHLGHARSAPRTVTDPNVSRNLSGVSRFIQ